MIQTAIFIPSQIIFYSLSNMSSAFSQKKKINKYLNTPKKNQKKKNIPKYKTVIDIKFK